MQAKWIVIAGILITLLGNVIPPSHAADRGLTRTSSIESRGKVRTAPIDSLRDAVRGSVPEPSGDRGLSRENVTEPSGKEMPPPDFVGERPASKAVGAAEEMPPPHAVGRRHASARRWGAAGEPLPLETFLSAVSKNNPEILATRERWEAAEAQVLPAKTWDNPRIGPNLWRIPSGKAPTTGNARMDMFMFEQKIPFPGKLSAVGKAAQHEARGLRREYEAAQRRVLSQAAQAYYRLWYLREQVPLHEAHAKLWERFSSVSERLYSSGKVTQRDVLLAQIELDKTTDVAASLREKLPAAHAALNVLANRSPDTLVGNLVPPALNVGLPKIESLEAKALEYNPELLSAEHHVQHRRFLLKKSRLDYLPDFTAGIATMEESNGFSGYNAKLFLSIPLYFWKQKSLVRSAQSSLREMERRHELVRNRVSVSLRDIAADMRNAARTAKLYKASILPRIRNALRVVESGYLAGKAGFLDLLDTESRLLMEEMRHLLALRQYGEARAEMDRVLGVNLDLAARRPQEKRR